MLIDGLQGLIGKQIAGIISVQGRKSGPHDQLFLLLDDNTYYEIYASELSWAGHAHPGGRDPIMATLHPNGGSISEIVKVENSGT